MTDHTHCQPLTRLPAHLKNTWCDIASVRPYTHPDKNADWIAKGLALFLRTITTAQRLALSYKSGIPFNELSCTNCKGCGAQSCPTHPRFKNETSCGCHKP